MGAPSHFCAQHTTQQAAALTGNRRWCAGVLPSNLCRLGLRMDAGVGKAEL